MKYSNLFTAIAITLVIASCGSSDSETQATPPTVSDTSTNPQTTNTVATPAATPVTIPAPTVATTPGASTTISAATTNSALNPEHGKPGHRCDIAVGAPLNSKPTTPATTTPATTTTPVNISTPVVTQNNSPLTTNSKTTASTAAGMNPEHGKPGHRCDIAVGAPLDSKPIQATIQQPAVTTTPAPKAALPYTPVTTQPTANTPVAKGMNPAHGQQGHRCDISVGAPLDSKPATPTVATEATKPKQ